MPRDVEVVTAAVPPPATSHTFSFTIKTSGSEGISATGNLKGAVGASWDLALAQTARSSFKDSAAEAVTYYGASLLVWTHADRTRTEAIRAVIKSGNKLRINTLAKAAKAAAASRRFGEKLTNQPFSFSSGIPLAPLEHGRSRTRSASTSGGETELDTEAYYTESEWEGGDSGPLTESTTDLPLLQSSQFWLPYALTIVSKYPIYDLLTDTLRLSWARYHLNITRHSMTMRKLLDFPAPRLSEKFRVPVDPLADAEGAFVMTFPGRICIDNGHKDIDFQIWPILRCLDADNLLRISEIALSSLGRVVIFSSNLYMLNLAVETLQYLLEPRGVSIYFSIKDQGHLDGLRLIRVLECQWKGITHGIVHVRDVKVYIEDPGPFLIGIDSRCRSLTHGIASEICIVDLETNSVRCPSPPPGSLSSGTLRLKMVKQLSESIGNVGYLYVGLC